MTPVTAAMVAKLRQETSETMMDCKKYLVQFEGDFDAALKYIQTTPYHMRRSARLDGKRCPCCGK
jgi:translation elongation factor EF-Ts